MKRFRTANPPTIGETNMIAAILLGRSTGLAVAAGLTALLCLLTNLSTDSRPVRPGAVRTGSVLKSGRWPLADTSRTGLL
jgi:hypothetical protein